MPKFNRACAREAPFLSFAMQGIMAGGSELSARDQWVGAPALSMTTGRRSAPS